jgi:MFS family permease
MQLLVLPWWGRFLDKWGRKPVLMISIGGNALCHLRVHLHWSGADFGTRCIASSPGSGFLRSHAFKGWDFSGPSCDDSYPVRLSWCLALLFLCHGAGRWWTGLGCPDIVELGVWLSSGFYAGCRDGLLSVCAVPGRCDGSTVCWGSL